MRMINPHAIKDAKNNQPMSDLIDRKALKEYWIDKRNNRGIRTATITDFIISVNEQPAIQQERTAEKVKNHPSIGGYVCTGCGELIQGRVLNFCPGCGARFKEDQHGR